MTLLVKHLGLRPYLDTWQAMRDFTDDRDDQTADELWIVQHPPVFTQGLNGKAEHLLNLKDNIPLVETDRGGQVTYHGPGQVVIYLLIDLKRAKLGVRDLVHRMEQAIIQTLAQYHIEGVARADAPGVYVDEKKIASLGLKVRKHRSYHGLALNVDMDLSPFTWVNPCGLKGMQMTQVTDWAPQVQLPQIENTLTAQLQTVLAPEIPCKTSVF